MDEAVAIDVLRLIELLQIETKLQIDFIFGSLVGPKENFQKARPRRTLQIQRRYRALNGLVGRRHVPLTLARKVKTHWPAFRFCGSSMSTT